MTDTIAHINALGNRQQVKTHLLETAEICSRLAAKIGLKNAGALIGLLHDLGKYSEEFQRYIKSAEGLYNPDEDEWVDAGRMKGKVDHSTAGAQLIWNTLGALAQKKGQGKVVAQILSLCIASHHSGLIDSVSVTDKFTFLDRMEKPEEKTHLEECVQNMDVEVREEFEQLANLDLVKDVFSIIRKISDDFGNQGNLLTSVEEQFHIGFLTRFLFSCLIDADRLNSAEFEDVEKKQIRLNKANPVSWDRAVQTLEHYLQELGGEGYVNDIRREISDNCVSRANDEQGIYTLTIPTGGGKTYTSLRYALHHARKHKLERIIYVIPFTSIIEQNADAIRDAFENDPEVKSWVLEHHSNLEPEKQTWHSKLAGENWDSPIVLTTSVQLLEAMFNGGTKGVRRLHQLADSILIFDEIQTLPINCIHLFCNALNFLTKYCRTTAVLCTATQPGLNELKRSDRGQLAFAENTELVGDYARYYQVLQRVDVINRVRPNGWNVDNVSELAIEQFNTQGSCLVIVNTKDWAQRLYQLCAAYVEQDALFHLSTNLCSTHRKRFLDEIRKRLEKNQPVLCISTQLIEAGVDVDFASVIRFLAGLDSIAQAAGRCNRGGKRKDEQGNLVKGQVFIVNPDNETTELLKDIEVGKEKAQTVLNAGYHDPISPEAIRQYFQEYYYNRSDDMTYRISDKSIRQGENLLNLLSKREMSCADFSSEAGKVPLMKHAFMEAGKQFKAIDAPTQAVIVQYGRGKELVEELCTVAKDFDAKRFYELLREAQQYSVNVFPNTWKKLGEQKAVIELQGEGIYYLDERYYSEEFGLSTEKVGQQNFLTF